MKQVLREIGGIIRHPIETFDEMKFRRYKSWKFVISVMVVWVIIAILQRQYTGFRFNMAKPDTLNVLVILARTVAPFFLFCIANWSICTLMDGEGKFSEICTYLAYALIPYIFGLIITIIVSNILVLDEGVFISWFNTFLNIYTVLILYQAIRVVHQYEFFKTLIAIALTVLIMLIFVIMGLLIYALFNQIFTFFGGVLSEIVFRYSTVTVIIIGLCVAAFLAIWVSVNWLLYKRADKKGGAM
jgi:hypothetical protein